MNIAETYTRITPRYAELSGRAALITGAGRGIGLAIALRLAREGMHLLLTDRSDEDLAPALAVLNAQGARAAGCAADLADPQQPERLVAAALEQLGGLDLLVNNAADLRRQNLLAVDEDFYDYQAAVNLKAPFFLTRRAAEAMIAARRGGSIVQISSVGGLRAHWRGLPYDLTKSALDSLARVAALELAPHGIRVNAVAPGATHRTLEAEESEGVRQAEARIPLGRFASALEIAAAVAFLASDESAYITGQTLYVDGGLTAQLHPPGQPV